jgi:hypothetical protein
MDSFLEKNGEEVIIETSTRIQIAYKLPVKFSSTQFVRNRRVLSEMRQAAGPQF